MALSESTAPGTPVTSSWIFGLVRRMRRYLGSLGVTAAFLTRVDRICAHIIGVARGR